MPVESRRLWSRIEYLARFGPSSGGGITRLAYSDEEKGATRAVEGWMRAAGLQVRYDAAGNLFGRLKGRRSGPAVLTGSHLDSVPNGGNFDGVAGVLTALEAVESLAEEGRLPDSPLEVVSFQGEEGSRFPVGLLGSSFLAGTFPGEPAALKDRAGTTLPDALRAYGLTGADPRTALAGPGEYAYFLEVHIEQSLLLESRGIPCGVVTGIAGLVQYRAVIEGRAEHAGACPMDLRRDALAGAAEMVLAAERAAVDSDPATRATVGLVRTFPGAANVIPGRVEMTFDIRDLDESRRDRCASRIREEFRALLARRRLSGAMEQVNISAPTRCDEGVMRAIEEAAAAAGIPTVRLPSGAVHDGANVARLCPIGMIFLRSRDGLSHNPAEYTSPEDLEAGALLLRGALERLGGLA
jgi:allantoate deiminase